MGSRAEVILDGRAQCTQASEDMVWVSGVERWGGGGGPPRVTPSEGVTPTRRNKTLFCGISINSTIFKNILGLYRLFCLEM